MCEKLPTPVLNWMYRIYCSTCAEEGEKPMSFAEYEIAMTMPPAEPADSATP